MQFDYSSFVPKDEQGQPQSNQPTTVDTSADKFDYSKFQSQDQGQQGGPPPGLEDTKALSFIAGFSDSISKLATGIVRSVLPENSSIDNTVMSSRNFVKMASNIAAIPHPAIHALGEVSGSVAAAVPLAMVAPEAGALATIGISTAGGALYGAATNPEKGETRSNNAVIGGITGLVGGAMGAALSGIAKRFPTNRIAEYGALGRPNKEVESAATRLGVEVSPFESNDSLVLKQALGKKTALNPQQITELSQHVKGRDEQLKQAFDDVVSSIAPTQDATAIYNTLKPRIIPTTALGDIMPQANTAKPNYAQRLYTEAHSPSSGLNFDAVQAGTFEDLLKTRQYISSKIKGLDTAVNAAGKQGVSSGAKGAAAKDLKDVKTQLTKALMSVSTKDELPVAESIVKKAGAIKNIQAKINDIPLTDPESASPSALQLFKQIAGTESKRNNFLKSVERNGGDIQKAKDFITVAQSLQNSPVEALLKKNTFNSSPFNVNDLAKTGAASYVAGPEVAAMGLGAKIANKALTNKAYYKQIFKDLPKKGSPGVLSKVVGKEVGVLSGEGVIENQ